MATIVGTVAALFRYPVKSMRGESLATALVDWHGLAGDRRVAVRRLGDQRGFPWLTASRLPELLRFAPERHGPDRGGPPTHVRTPEGALLPVFAPDLADTIGARHAAPVDLVHLDRGIFDAAGISLVGAATVATLCHRAGLPADVRRFRPNVEITTADAFLEDDWVGGVLTFGATAAAAAVYVTQRDERCAMVNLDPDTAAATPRLLQTIVRDRGNHAGVYATVVRPGRIEVGAAVSWAPGADRPRAGPGA